MSTYKAALSADHDTAYLAFGAATITATHKHSGLAVAIALTVTA